eukprot:TRINITY_DN7110_c0_g1_i1.p1 TRINITY_DN7110_c0_g1~~TRINITY_DN7110_c0_g1_i1.p1  ORF type:complete len:659 (+),score=178.99 TRINITY_DN7110_c0_g1_i1:100-2076(+)
MRLRAVLLVVCVAVLALPVAHAKADRNQVLSVALERELLSSVSSSSSSSSSSLSVAASGAEECGAMAWERYGGFVIYLALLAFVFYGYALLCDEFFVPALNIFCDKMKMPDDFAGATLMAAGGCAPDLFSASTGVLILHSDVGVGTIVGSLLFNHLCIIGATAVAVGVLVLEWKTVLREAVFYLISLVVLLVFLIDKKIMWWEAAILVAIYVVYVIVCAYYAPVQRFLDRLTCCAAKKREYEPLVINTESQPDLLEIEKTSGTLIVASSESDNIEAGSETEKGNEEKKIASSPATTSEGTETIHTLRRTAENVQRRVFMRTSSSLIANHGFGPDYPSVSMHGHLYKQSRFYTKMRVNKNSWQRRWFMLGDSFSYCKNPLFPNEGLRKVPLWRANSVTLRAFEPCVFDIFLEGYTYTLKAEDPETAKQWVGALQIRLRMIKDEMPGIDEFEFEDEHRSLLTLPEGGFFKKLTWILTLPISFALTYTIPNVKKEKWEKFYPLTFIMCLVWLAIMSYCLVFSADRFACAVGLSEDIMGLTITAVGASLPSLFSSVIAARRGMAGMAVSNAFGANTFTILIALGFPSLLATLFVHPGQPFPMDSDSIVLTVFVLSVALGIFLIVAGFARLRLNRIVGVFFILLYIGLIAFVVVSNYMHIVWI